MILPTKHIKTDRSLIGLGAVVLQILIEPMTVSALWNAFRSRRTAEQPKSPINYKWFILTLDFLFIIGAIEFKRGTIRKRTKL